ncbi:MAG: ABC transporter substrate-binding protein [Alicyclobacillus herbarius]|uniref:ABC transporter substrate-binding protein n=1 Tax=Alicyclobacillus herbarius TaxID=122960 RepID=UPI002356C7B8|nr:ABC transporter substrate-binding protein [Alicyclobacillus herbarius]MCL6632771.1 ABC transporter substrate-binding protein [Alicyclobacillus herbarius]
MKGKNKAMAAGVSALLACSVVAGCGTSSSPSNTANATNTANAGAKGGSKPIDFSHAKGTIVWAAPPITHTGLRKTLIQKFEQEHPNIKVKLQNQDSNTDTDRASLTTAIGGGSNTPDVYMGDVVWPAQFAANQLAEPLSGLVPDSFWNRFADGLVQGATYKGKVYAAPFFVDTAFLYYRKDLLKKAGLPVPKTWADVQKDSEILQKKGLVKYGFVWQGASYEGLLCDFNEYLADAGGQVLGSDGKPALDSAAGKKALNFMRGLITSGVSPTSEVQFQENESLNVFTEGNAAFLRNWSYAWPSSQDPKASKVVGKVGVTALPSFSGGPGYSTIGGWDLYINPHTKNLPAALAFIDWMTGKEAQTILAKDFSEIPTNKQVQNDPTVKQKSPIFAIVPKVKYVSRPSQNPNYPAIAKAVYSNVNAALAGSVSTNQALSNASKQIESALGGNGGL